jgi:hypothetical protein
MWQAYGDVFWSFWLGWATSVLAIIVCSFFLHVSTLWLIVPQFVQNLSVFPVLLHVFGGATCFVLYVTNSALLVSRVVIPSSHNIVVSLFYWSVNYFIPIVAILKYHFRLALNIVVMKLFVVGTCKPWTSFWIYS